MSLCHADFLATRFPASRLGKQQGSAHARANRNTQSRLRQHSAQPVADAARMWQHRPMSTEPLAWNEQFAGQLVTAEGGNATYYIDSSHSLGVAAYVRVRDPRDGKCGVCLGSFRTIEEAKQKCERHFAHGSDVNAAERV
jgi:hypothetical protein